MGDIIPNQESFMFNRKKIGDTYNVQLGNVTKKVHNAIIAVLDMYFACKCDEFTIKQTYELEKMGTIMEAHLLILWNLKQTVMYEIPRGTLMRKPHASSHIGEFIRKFGPIIYADTDVFESSHKSFTTGVWRGTSKRLSTLVKEMTIASIIQSHSGYLKFYNTLLPTNGISECLAQFGPRAGSDGLTINAFTNLSDIRFIATSKLYNDGKTNILEGVGHKNKLFNELFKKDHNFIHNSLPSMKHLSQHLQNNFNEWEKCTSDNTLIEFSVVNAISYEGSKESGVGKGVLYATADNAGKGPRYDYVTVETEYTNNDTGEEVKVDCVAQVLMIIQTHEYKNEKRERKDVTNDWFLIIQYMQPVTVYANNPPNTIKHTSISQQTWEIRDLKKSKASIPLNDNNNFVINMISIDALVGSVMIVPFFSLHQNNKNQSTNKIDSPVFGQPKTSDKFWCVDRIFLTDLVGKN